MIEPRMRDTSASWLARQWARFGRSLPEQKASRTAGLVAMHHIGEPVWTPRDYRALARQGYQTNPVVFRCVRLIAETAASVPWLFYAGDEELQAHPFKDLLTKPNTHSDGSTLMEAVFGHLLLSGNAYIECVTVDEIPAELHALRPDRMRVIAGDDGWPSGFEYAVGAQKVRFEQDGSPPPILHIKLFHPDDDHYGMSPLEAAQRALDLHNSASSWNKALLDNAARPSGALIYGGAGQLSQDQFERLKLELQQNFEGPLNAGRPLLLEGGLDWKPLSMSPKDMDFLEAKNTAAREIALAFGVPPMLLGIPGDNTYANYAEANRALWRETVLPLVGRTAKAISTWMSPAFGDDIRLWYDADSIEALSQSREALWQRVSAADFLTDDEKREAVGYGPLEL